MALVPTQIKTETATPDLKGPFLLSSMIGPRSMDGMPQSSMGANLQHRPSAKLLINRYEAMTPPPSSHQSHPAARQRGESLSAPLKDGPPTPKKDKSPLRKSLRNFLSVIKKGTGLSKHKHDDDILGRPYLEQDIPENLPKAPTADPHAALEVTRPITPPRRSGPLLYLAQAEQSPNGYPLDPMWLSCTATMEERAISVSWFSSEGIPCTYHIKLSRCADVRSLSLRHLGPEEIALLPTIAEGEELKIFEILFEGKARERFAATSNRERAGWISTIWDAILPSQESKNRIQRESETTLESDLNGKESRPSGPPVQSPIPTPLPISSPLLSPTYPEHPLPPVPSKTHLTPLTIPTQPLNVHKLPPLPQLGPSPVSPSVYTSASPSVYSSAPPPASRGGSGGLSRPSSPSITNLGRLSVVKQRLHQIERGQSQFSEGSASGLPTPPSPLRSTGRSYNFSRDSMDSKAQSSSGSTLKTCHTIDRRSVDRAAENESNHSKCTELSDLLRDQSAKTDALQQNIQTIPRDMATIKSVLGGESGFPTIHQMVVGLDHRMEGTGEVLKRLQDSLKVIHERQSGNGTPLATDVNGSDLVQTLQAMRTQLGIDLPAVLEKLSKIQETTEHKSNNLDGPSTSNEAPLLTELAPVNHKLDELLSAMKATRIAGGPDNGADRVTSEELGRVISLLEDDNAHRAIQAQQQADSVRYLNELNTWLEAFVNNGTSHIQGLAASVDQLCNDLGNGNQSSDSLNKGPSLLKDVQNLVIQMRARDQGSAALHISINKLIETLNANPQKGADSQSVAAIIEHQQRQQESMFKAFTSEIHGEIKGERLRFVDAMREATAINVQLHVEEFKKELSRQMAGMNEEVGRLYQEKQAIEQQIVGLAEHYARQQAAIIPRVAHQTSLRHSVAPGMPSQPPQVQYRPLPRPHRR